MAKYNMTFEEAQEYISKRGFDIAWNDCDVFIDVRHITQAIGNVLKWADNNPVEYTRTDAFIEEAQDFFRQSHHLLCLDGNELHHFIEDFRKYMEGE